MNGDRMNFETKLPGMFRDLMTSALEQADVEGLINGHHFYITFDTTHDGVSMAESLRAVYPETITIVLQHEFWDLKITDVGFSVSLSFNSVPHPLTVPFDAVIGFADPSINFGIQFKAPLGRPTETSVDATTDRRADGQGEVVALDAFRKK